MYVRRVFRMLLQEYFIILSHLQERTRDENVGENYIPIHKLVVCFIDRVSAMSATTLIVNTYNPGFFLLIRDLGH